MTIWPTVAATGHRRLPPAHALWVRGELDQVAAKLAAECGTTTAVTGMAMGVDLWWADSAWPTLERRQPSPGSTAWGRLRRLGLDGGPAPGGLRRVRTSQSLARR